MAEAKRYFPRGIDDIVNNFHIMINDAMATKIIAKRNFATLRVRDKITFAVRTRLESLGLHREAVRRLLIYALHPRNMRDAMRHVWQAADAIWIAAGDTASDYNYYTKRLLLIAVMKSTLSFWLNDTSTNYKETWEFLDRRIADVMALGKGMSIIKTVGISDIVSLVRHRFAV